MIPGDSDVYPPPRDSGPARELARGLIDAPGVREGKGRTPAHAAAAACNRLYQNLSRWVGPDGCHALFVRALAHARTAHEPLATIQLRARSEPLVDGVAATIMAYGDPATAEALEAALIGLIELLGRLIGDDMTTRLIEATSSTLPSDAANAREEA